MDLTHFLSPTMGYLALWIVQGFGIYAIQAFDFAMVLEGFFCYFGLECRVPSQGSLREFREVFLAP